MKDNRRAKDFLELHQQVQTSVKLLDSLESFLSTFQSDLCAVSGQISDLQDRSKDIENRLRSRRRIEKSLSSLLSDITIPPALATLILDTSVGEPWIDAIRELEIRLEKIKARLRVKAARDLVEVVEGLRIVAATKLRAFFFALFHPIRSSVTTNIQVMQMSVLLKYSNFFAFLLRRAPNVAHDVQISYLAAARVYYETGFRRYIRSLSAIKARMIEKHESIVNTQKGSALDFERLVHAKIDGPGVTLAFMADDKAHKEPIEALLRSLLLVFTDSATADYNFVKAFFSREDKASRPSLDKRISSDDRSQAETDSGGRDRPAPVSPPAHAADKQIADSIWKQIWDPVLVYCEELVRSILEPAPPVIPLLTMIRLTENVILEVQKRDCAPIEFFIFSLRLQMWPVFQKGMADNVDALKKMAEGIGTGYFSRAVAITDEAVLNICRRYTVMFNSFVVLTEQEEETMIFSNLVRLRQELTKLILKSTEGVMNVSAKAQAQSLIYEAILQGLNSGPRTAHPKAQQEIAYWSNLVEEANRKVISADHIKF